MLLKAYGKHIDTAPIERIFTQGEKFSDVIKFSIPAVNNDIDISDCTFRMRTAVAGTTNTTETELEKQLQDDRLILSWSVSEYVTAVPGMLLLELVGTKNDATIIKYHLPAVYVQEQLLEGCLPEPDIIEQKISQMNDILSQAQAKLDQAQSTAVEIDPTLTIEGQAADAKAAGDRLTSAENAFEGLALSLSSGAYAQMLTEVTASRKCAMSNNTYDSLNRRLIADFEQCVDKDSMLVISENILNEAKEGWEAAIAEAIGTVESGLSEVVDIPNSTEVTA